MQLCPCHMSEQGTPNMQLRRICFSLPFCTCILSVCCMRQGVGLESLLSVSLGFSSYGAIDRTQTLRNSSQKFYHGSSPQLCVLVFNLTFCTIPHSQVGCYLHFFFSIYQGEAFLMILQVYKTQQYRQRRDRVQMSPTYQQTLCTNQNCCPRINTTPGRMRGAAYQCHFQFKRSRCCPRSGPPAQAVFATQFEQVYR